MHKTREWLDEQQAIEGRVPNLLLVDSEKATGVTYWRMTGPWSELAKKGLVRITHHHGKVTDHMLYEFDAILMCHLMNGSLMELCERANRAGVPVFADFDDDLLNPPVYNPGYHDILKQTNNFWGLLTKSTVLSTSTRWLKEKYENIEIDGPDGTKVKPLAGKIHYWPNAIKPEEIPARWNGLEKKYRQRVVWRGATHGLRDLWMDIKDLETMVRNRYMFVWVGVPVPFLDPDHMKYVPWGAVSGYLRVLRELNPAFIWKPLEFIDFNRGKSNIALLEAAHAGALCLTNFKDCPDYPYDDWLPSVRVKEMKSFSDERFAKRFEEQRLFIEDSFNLHKVNRLRYKALMNVLKK